MRCPWPPAPRHPPQPQRLSGASTAVIPAQTLPGPIGCIARRRSTAVVRDLVRAAPCRARSTGRISRLRARNRRYGVFPKNMARVPNCTAYATPHSLTTRPSCISVRNAPQFLRVGLTLRKYLGVANLPRITAFRGASSERSRLHGVDGDRTHISWVERLVFSNTRNGCPTQPRDNPSCRPGIIIFRQRRRRQHRPSCGF